MHFVLDHMHTKISIDLPEYSNPKIIEELNNLFSSIENRFSVFIKDSEVNKFADGLIALNNISADLKHIIALSKVYKAKTNGYFNIYFNNRFNPTGIVKSWAIKQAENLLAKHKIVTYMINAGGDIACASSGKKEWSIAIANPQDTKNIIAVIKCKNLCIATSGAYERGEHIINPLSGKSTNELLSVSVMSNNINDSDVYATALFAMGDKAIAFAKNNKLKVIMVDKSGNIFQN